MIIRVLLSLMTMTIISMSADQDNKGVFIDSARKPVAKELTSEENSGFFFKEYYTMQRDTLYDVPLLHDDIEYIKGNSSLHKQLDATYLSYYSETEAEFGVRRLNIFILFDNELRIKEVRCSIGSHCFENMSTLCDLLASVIMKTSGQWQLKKKALPESPYYIMLLFYGPIC